MQLFLCLGAFFFDRGDLPIFIYYVTRACGRLTISRRCSRWWGERQGLRTCRPSGARPGREGVQRFEGADICKASDVCRAVDICKVVDVCKDLTTFAKTCAGLWTFAKSWTCAELDICKPQRSGSVSGCGTANVRSHSPHNGHFATSTTVLCK